MPLFPRLFSLKRYVTTHPFAVLILTVASLGIVGSGLKYLEDDADRQKLLKPNERSALARFNPFLAPPSPTPTPQLSKEYIYAGSRLLAVEDANANAAPPADLAVWRPPGCVGTGCYAVWYVLGGVQGFQQVTESWGLEGDIPVPGDYDGDGKTDFSIFRRADPTSNYAKWYVLQSSDGSYSIIEWGLEQTSNPDVPAAADYDGDGKTDRAVFRPNDPSSGLATWYVLNSSTNSSTVTQYGFTGDIPAPADYDGDGRADHAVWRSSDTNFYSLFSSNSTHNTINFQLNGTAVSGDYDGDGKSDFAIRNGTTWIILKSSNGQTDTISPSGDDPSDTPVPNDYDGDGKCDIAVWRNSNGHWYIRKSASNNALRDEWWGLPGDIPVPANYRR